MKYKELTEKIIGAAIEVHRELGPGFLESVYENSLIIELQKKNLLVEKQLEVPVWYDGKQVGLHRVDVLVEKTIVTLEPSQELREIQAP